MISGHISITYFKFESAQCQLYWQHDLVYICQLLNVRQHRKVYLTYAVLLLLLLRLSTLKHIVFHRVCCCCCCWKIFVRNYVNIKLSIEKLAKSFSSPFKHTQYSSKENNIELTMQSRTVANILFLFFRILALSFPPVIRWLVW